MLEEKLFNKEDLVDLNVDAIVIFEEDNPLTLIQKLRQDVFVNGGDYSLDNIVGAQNVLEYDENVKVLDFIEGYFTITLIEKIRSTTST